jgi:hypothetical protein
VIDTCIDGALYRVATLRGPDARTHVARRNDQQSIEASERLAERLGLIEVTEPRFDAERAQLVRRTRDTDELCVWGRVTSTRQPSRRRDVRSAR